MEILTIKCYEDIYEKRLKQSDKMGAKAILGVIEELKKKLPHSCGSEEFYLAPIVNIRCAKCNQPL